MEKSLINRVALITGAGNGIGKETALLLAAKGAIVAVNDLKDEFTQPVVETITKAGGKAFAITQDISTRAGAIKTVELAYAHTNRLDILVNNAAWVRYQAIADIQPETMERMLDVGFKSVIWSIQAAEQLMNNELGGSIINVASVAGIRSASQSIVYSGIKAGILGVTRAAAAELGSKLIRVNAICPSAIPTEGTQKHRNAERDASRISRTPLGRLGTTTDIAQAICFLASDESRFISAQHLVIDGGTTFTNIG